MKKKLELYHFTWLIILISILFITKQSIATQYCVANDAELTAALNDAGDDVSNDVIRIQKGTYIGRFSYNSTEPFGLTVEGGYNVGCTSAGQ